MNASWAMSSAAAASWTTSHAARYARGQCSAKSASKSSADPRCAPATNAASSEPSNLLKGSDPWLRVGTAIAAMLLLRRRAAPEVPLATIPACPSRSFPAAGFRREPRPTSPRRSRRIFVPPPAEEGTNGLAIAALVCAVSSLGLLVLSLGLSFILSLPLGLAGWACAARAPKDVRPGQLKTGQVLSIIAVALERHRGDRLAGR